MVSSIMPEDKVLNFRIIVIVFLSNGKRNDLYSQASDQSYHPFIMKLTGTPDYGKTPTIQTAGVSAKLRVYFRAK